MKNIFLLLFALLSICLKSSAQITLPVEVFKGAPVSKQFNIAVMPSGNMQLSLTLHGMEYPAQVGVQVNNAPQVKLTNSTCSVQGTSAYYGGIGGGFCVQTVLVSIPSGVLVSGENTVTFTQVYGTGVSSQFRVLAFNVLSNGVPLLPSSTFVNEDANSWTPPLNDAADIASGKTLFQTANIVQNDGAAALPIKAHCGDCHTIDGRDLKYFNYSNNSIINRSIFHGLTQLQGEQIASYIRSLTSPNPGSPWNPPYQPGTGLDVSPYWSAGAGVSAVLSNDAGMYNFLPTAFKTTDNLNIRQIPIALQFPDWNHWLPRVHPLDAFGADFTSSRLLYDYNGTGTAVNQWNLTTLLSSTPTASLFAPNKVTGTIAQFNQWGNDRYVLTTQELAKYGVAGASNSSYLSEWIYSTALWQLVKMWELTQTYGLEGYGDQVFGATYAEMRTWFVSYLFQSSPFFLHINDGPGGIGGSAITNEYFSNIWYQVQLTLNDSNHANQGTSPIDWPYVYGKLKDMYNVSDCPEPYRLTEYIMRGMQISDNGLPPGANGSGWQPTTVGDISRFVHPSFTPMFNSVPAATKTQLFTTMAQSWINKTNSFTPAQYYAGGLASSVEVVTSAMDGDMGGKTMFMLPLFGAAGVPVSILQQVSTWANSVYPKSTFPISSTPVIANPVAK